MKIQPFRNSAPSVPLHSRAFMELASLFAHHTFRGFHNLFIIMNNLGNPSAAAAGHFIISVLRE